MKLQGDLLSCCPREVWNGNSVTRRSSEKTWKAKGLCRDEYGFASKLKSLHQEFVERYSATSTFKIVVSSLASSLDTRHLSQTGRQRQRKQLLRYTHLTLSLILRSYSNPLNLSNEEALSRNTIANSTVVCLVTKPLSGSEADVEFVLIGTSVLFVCKCEQG